MAKTRESDAEALMDITARLPWWGGVGLAIVSYVLLHALAQKPLVTSLQPGLAASFVISAMLQALAGIGQYVLPPIFLLGAGMSAYKRRQSAQLHAAAANRAEGVGSMTWLEFEALVGEYFRRQGFTVLQQGGAGPDGGVDLLLKKGTDRYLVQCKHWRALRVGVQPVRELYGVMAAQRVAGGFMVTSGEFTEEARSFAQARELQLIDGTALQTGIRAQTVSAPRLAVSTPGQPRLEEAAPALSASSALDCPKCNAPMVLRQVKSGPVSGRKFWGCSTYAQTKCRGTREVASSSLTRI